MIDQFQQILPELIIRWQNYLLNAKFKQFVKGEMAGLRFIQPDVLEDIFSDELHYLFLVFVQRLPNVEERFLCWLSILVLERTVLEFLYIGLLCVDVEEQKFILLEGYYNRKEVYLETSALRFWYCPKNRAVERWGYRKAQITSIVRPSWECWDHQ